MVLLMVSHWCSLGVLSFKRSVFAGLGYMHTPVREQSP